MAKRRWTRNQTFDVIGREDYFQISKHSVIEFSLCLLWRLGFHNDI